MANPANIVVRAPNWIGDHVMALSAYRELRRLYPGARLTLLTLPSVSGLPFADLFDAHMLLPSRHRNRPGRLWAEARRLRRERFDLAVCLPTSLSAALLFCLAGIPHRVGFAAGGSDLFHTDSVPWPGRRAGVHKTELYRRLPELLGGKGSLPPEPSPAAADPAARGNFIVVAPGASIPLREWPYYPDLLRRIRDRYWAFRLLVVGTAAEGKWHSIIQRMADPKVEDWIGRTKLEELVTLCRGARLVIANDSGVAHVAATLAGAPTLVLFGPGDPVYIQPRGAEVHGVRLEGLPCSPCESPRCRETYGYQKCLRALTPEAVFERVTGILS